MDSYFEIENDLWRYFNCVNFGKMQQRNDG